jgi:dephospho-CoA kinase|tara:strand:- start:1219 stop:1833 length:615 start_codon:yes stop_codon:yes gene_type:complete
MPPVLTIALTGGIGSGKTSIASIFKSLGVPIIDSDTISKEIILPGKPCFKDIVNEFGEEILTNKGTIDRYKLRDIIFNNDKARIKLENIIHPVVFKNIDTEISLINYPYCLVIIPLLIETKSTERFDRILVIDALESLQFERIVKRDDISPILIKKIIKTQAKRKERLRYANDIIVNNDKIMNLNKSINTLHKKYLGLSNNNHK